MHNINCSVKELPMQDLLNNGNEMISTISNCWNSVIIVSEIEDGIALTVSKIFAEAKNIHPRAHFSLITNDLNDLGIKPNDVELYDPSNPGKIMELIRFFHSSLPRRMKMSSQETQYYFPPMRLILWDWHQNHLNLNHCHQLLAREARTLIADIINRGRKVNMSVICITDILSPTMLGAVDKNSCLKGLKIYAHAFNELKPIMNFVHDCKIIGSKDTNRIVENLLSLSSQSRFPIMLDINSHPFRFGYLSP